VSRFRTEAAIALSCHHEISALELGLFAVFGKTKRAKGNCSPVDLFLSGRRVAPSAISLLACFVESAASIRGYDPGDRRSPDALELSAKVSQGVPGRSVLVLGACRVLSRPVDNHAGGTLSRLSFQRLS